MNKKLRVFAAVTGVLLGVCVVIGTFLMTHAIAAQSRDLFSVIQVLSYTLMAFFGLYYLFIGCKKQIGATLFKVYLSLFALCLFIQFFNVDYMRTSSFYVADTALRFAIICVLLLAKDLGNAKSMILAALVLLISFVEMVILYFSPAMDWTNWLGALVAPICGIVLFLFICFKYADKAARGRK